MGSVAGKAARRVQAAMKVNHLGAARAFMQIVYILRDDGQLGNVPGQCCNCQVSAIGGGTPHFHAQPFVPTPDQILVGAIGGGGGQVLNIKALPQAGEGVTKGGDAAFSRNPGAGKDDDML